MSVRVSTSSVSLSACSGLMYLGRPDDKAMTGKQRSLDESTVHRLGDSEIDHLGNRPFVLDHDQHIGWLQIPMDHSLVVRVLYRITDLKKQS